MLWGCLLESPALPERLRELRRDPKPARAERRWKWPAVLIAADLSLALPALHWSFSPALDAALAGAWFVALADLVSVWVGFLLCPWEPYPLNDPPITTMSFYVAVARQRSSGAGNV